MTPLKRFVIVVLSLAFLTGVTAQSLFAASIKPAQAGAMARDGGDAQNPCKGATPLCTDHAGCVLMTALTMTPGLAPVLVEWDGIEYGEFTVAFDGRSVAPELSPPIPTV